MTEIRKPPLPAAASVTSSVDRGSKEKAPEVEPSAAPIGEAGDPQVKRSDPDSWMQAVKKFNTFSYYVDEHHRYLNSTDPGPARELMREVVDKVKDADGDPALSMAERERLEKAIEKVNGVGLSRFNDSFAKSLSHLVAPPRPLTESDVRSVAAHLGLRLVGGGQVDTNILKPGSDAEKYLSSRAIQTADEGVGPLVHRKYQVTIEGGDADKIFADIRANFPSYADPKEVHFYPTRVPIDVGDRIYIEAHNTGMKHEVRDGVVVTALEDTGNPKSFTYATLEGHAFAGTITFKVEDLGGSKVEVSVSSETRFGNTVAQLSYEAIGKKVQTRLWQQFLSTAVQRSGGAQDGAIRQELEVLDAHAAPGTSRSSGQHINGAVAHGTQALKEATAALVNVAAAGGGALYSAVVEGPVLAAVVGAGKLLDGGTQPGQGLPDIAQPESPGRLQAAAASLARTAKLAGERLEAIDKLNVYRLVPNDTRDAETGEPISLDNRTGKAASLRHAQLNVQQAAHQAAQALRDIGAAISSPPDSLPHVDERTVLVTGASSGIGASLAEELARRGFTVWVAARGVDRLEEVVARITAAGGKAHAVAIDITDVDATREKILQVDDEAGGLDIVVANAGVTGEHYSPWSDDVSDMAAVVSTNVSGTLATLMPLLPRMKERGHGHIVGMSSLMAETPIPAGAIYGASKAAVSFWLEGLTPELETKGVAVTTIEPGAIRTGAAKASPMPMMDVDVAARRIADAIEHRQRKLRFPTTASAATTIAAALPIGLRAYLARKAMGGSFEE